MIEYFNHRYDRFFDEKRCEVRWKRLRTIYSEDYASFRVLFCIETLALVNKWREPTPRELNALLRHQLTGGRVGVRIGNMIDLFQPVWPLEVAKYEYIVHRALYDSPLRHRYILTGIRSLAVALVQAWWAFETLMNDFAAIVAKNRKATLDETSLALLDEKRPSIDKAGSMVLESYYQPLLPRLQFIYHFLTGEKLDRGGAEWRYLVELKDIRDTYVHRIAKANDSSLGLAAMDTTLVKGFEVVRSILGRVLTKTPEFAARFVYRYLAFWSCGSEAPFIWDGAEGNSFYLGLSSVNKEAVVSLFAPIPGSFHIPQGKSPLAVRATSTTGLVNGATARRAKRGKRRKNQ